MSEQKEDGKFNPLFEKETFLGTASSMKTS